MSSEGAISKTLIGRAPSKATSTSSRSVRPVWRGVLIDDTGPIDHFRGHLFSRFEHSQTPDSGASTIQHGHGRCLIFLQFVHQFPDLRSISLLGEHFFACVSAAPEGIDSFEIFGSDTQALDISLHPLPTRSSAANGAVGEITNGAVLELEGSDHVVFANRFVFASG